MKIVMMTVAAVALLMAPAYAQQQTGLGAPYMHLPTEKEHIQKEESTVTKADDKAYKSALDAIPQPKNFDPWKNVRAKPAAR